MNAELILQRKIFNVTPPNCIGELFLNGEFFCYTLEDQTMWDGEKVHGETAIPAIKYQVRLTMSSKFKKKLPLIFNMPDLSIEHAGVKFAGVRLHGGNTEADSLGCPLVAYNTDGKKIWGSASANLVAALEKFTGEITLEIQNKPFNDGLNKSLII